LHAIEAKYASCDASNDQGLSATLLELLHVLLDGLNTKLIEVFLADGFIVSI
jgi:hypothetical protein